MIAVGGGNASLVAALSAHEAGARVALLECAPKVERGGNSRFAGAIFCVVQNGRSNIKPLLYPSNQKSLFSTLPHQALHLGGLRSRYAAYHKDQCDRAQIEVMFQHSYETVKWMRGPGREVAAYPPGSSSAKMLSPRVTFST